VERSLHEAGRFVKQRGLPNYLELRKNINYFSSGMNSKDAIPIIYMSSHKPEDAGIT
jgi:hypothetical protein